MTDDEYVHVGLKRDLDRLLDEYGLSPADVADLVRSKVHRFGPNWTEEQWSVHQSILRSHGEFPCAGDQEALEFCREIVQTMTRRFGISADEAVALVNAQWSVPHAPGGPVPRVWLVGLDIAYHWEVDTWAEVCYGIG